MEYKDVYILAEEANTYDTPNRSIEAGIFTDAFIKGYEKGLSIACEWVSVNDKLPPIEKQGWSKTVMLNYEKNVDFTLGFYDHFNMVWMDVNLSKICPPTHWKLLPPKP